MREQEGFPTPEREGVPAGASTRRSCSLPDLPAHVLAAYALALVGFGRSQRANLGSDLTDALLVDSPDDDLGRLGYLEADPLRARDTGTAWEKPSASSRSSPFSWAR